MSFLDALKNENNMAYTENGAEALSSTLNHCLDAFGSLGAMKLASEEMILDIFKSAFAEDKKTAMRLLFYIRDIRGGQGMRRVFRIIVKWLADNYPEFIKNNLNNFAEFGRWDDLFVLFDTELKNDALEVISRQLFTDIDSLHRGESISLLPKWLASENASSERTKELAKTIRTYLGWRSRTYRKVLSSLRAYSNVVEVKMSANEWEKIDYSAVPGKASLNYSNAFANHDGDRYIDFLSNATDLNANALFPVDIIHNVLKKYWKCSAKDRILLDKMWNSLPNYLEGKEETGICMVDTSGSMSGTPYEVALSLGIYCADKCKGPFKNHFITFSYEPNLVELVGDDIVEKVSNIRCINAGNTDIEAAFQLILDAAVKNNTPAEDMPSKLYIISDMQFDYARGEDLQWYTEKKPNQTFMDKMRTRFENHGYKLPTIVYWNVRASKCGMFQQKFDGEDCAIVSGYSSSLFKSVIEGTVVVEEKNENGEKVVREKIDPMTVMMNTLYKERYDCIWVG